MRVLFLLIVGSLGLQNCSQAKNTDHDKENKTKNIYSAQAIFAGGCFWCMEAPFEKLEGVGDVISGFSGGEAKNPSYKNVASGKTRHREVVLVPYNPNKVSYNTLLEIFWRQIDPTDKGGQFVDRGFQYSSAIYYFSEEQKKLASKSLLQLEKLKRFKKKIITPILKAKAFYPAEKYHQNFYKESSLRYKYYRHRSGRDQFIDKNWGEDKVYRPSIKQSKYTRPGLKEIKSKLTQLQFEVTQKDATERPFQNKYWDNKRVGIYVDVVSGEPLFSSVDKFKSGTGWPSFTKPLVANHVVYKRDRGLFGERVEVRSQYGESHLGHVFDDGPKPTGKRYCINSAALEFIPIEELEGREYGEFLSLFKK